VAAQRGPMPSRLAILDLAAIAVWGVGFFFEAVSEWQMARFRANRAKDEEVTEWAEIG